MQRPEALPERGNHTELNAQGVIDSQNITVQDGNGRRQTNTFILTFNTTEPPTYTMVGSYERVKVEVYIPNPQHCFNCQRFGHGQRNCQKNHPVCSFCGTNGHRQEDCKSNTPCCANCSGCHPAHLKECPNWQVEHQVQKITAQHGVSFSEAHRMLARVDSTCDDLPKCTMVNITSGSFTRNIQSISQSVNF